MPVLKTNSLPHRTLREDFFARIGQTSPSPIALEIVKAEGVFLEDASGKKYVDLISGVSVSNLGHGRREVVEAVCRQMEQYAHLMVYGEIIESPQVQLATLLTSQLPASLNCVYFVNSGSEANEAAMKLAKRLTARPNMVSFTHAYHGSTQGALSLMSDSAFNRSFYPLLPGVTHLPFNDIEALAAIDEQTACVVIEPVQAEGGVIVPRPGFLQAVRHRCDQTGALLIFDEIQTGFGRTGHLFAMETYGVTPHIVTFAKALGGGMPLGALVCHDHLMKAWQSNPVLGHITTFGGHPVSCAAGLASLQLLLQEDYVAQVGRKAARITQLLSAHPQVKEIRSAGLLMAVELGSEEKVTRLLSLLLEEGAMADSFMYCPTAFRIAPPLSISYPEIESACRIVWQALDRL